MNTDYLYLIGVELIIIFLIIILPYIKNQYKKHKYKEIKKQEDTVNKVFKLLSQNIDTEDQDLLKDCLNINEEENKMEPNNIEFKDVRRVWSWSRSEGTEFKYPEKGSKYAAGYDFYYNDKEPITIEPNEIEYVKTGIKAKFPYDKALLLLNRSSNPKKKHLVLANGIGLVDADYYNNSDNEGEIAFAFMNISSKPVTINYGDKLGQGMFVDYYDTTNYDSEIVEEREGGFGSTDKEK